MPGPIDRTEAPSHPQLLGSGAFGADRKSQALFSRARNHASQTLGSSEGWVWGPRAEGTLPVMGTHLIVKSGPST